MKIHTVYIRISIFVRQHVPTSKVVGVLRAYTGHQLRQELLFVNFGVINDI